MKHFTIDEFDCSETGENDMSEEFLNLLDSLREECGFPFHITSGFRSRNHSKERDKPLGGKHTRGIAADIRVRNGSERYAVVKYALLLGFSGIGVAKTFVHVDTRRHGKVMWTY